MYLDYPALRQALAVSLRHFSPRRAGTAALYGATHLTFRQLTATMQRVDDLLYPAYRDQAVTAPVFIYANPRSGTTLLHRLMSLDEERFATIKLYQTIFASVTTERAFEALGRVDEVRLGGRLRGVVDWINDTFFDRWEDVHPLGIDQPEEDELTFLYSFLSPTIGLAVPYLAELDRSVWFDALPADTRRRFMDHYERALKRFLFAEGGDKRLLDKNVFLAPRVPAVAARFPDAVFIHLVRHPAEAVPSFISMFYEAWKTHSPDIAMDSAEARALCDVALRYYEDGLRAQAALPPERFITVRYEELTADPRATVEGIYERLGMTMSAAFRERLAAATREERGYESKHTYSLEQFGITRAQLYKRFQAVYETYGYALDPASATDDPSPSANCAA